MLPVHRLCVEQLEDRTTPSAYGVPWPDALHLTISFVLDQTAAGPNQSELFRLLDARFERSVWQQEILRAFQAWTPHANINFTLASDSGLPLGTDGVAQGDTRFGDIRIAAYPMADTVVAVASPFSVLAGTWSGDVKLNSTLFDEGGPYDLFSVVLHEVGHVLGLDHSGDPSSVMYEDYLGVHTGPAALDIAALQALYGVREPDADDARAANDTIGTAARLDHSGGSRPLGVDADLTTATDIDYYEFRLPGGSGGATVRLRALSLLQADLQVFDEDANPVAAVRAAGPGQDVAISFSGSPSRSYHVRVGPASPGVFGIGSYRLEVTPDNAQGSANGGNGGPGQGNGSPPVVNLQQRIHRTDARFDYVATGELALSGEVDQYRFTAPRREHGQANVLTVMAWATDSSHVRPRLSLRTADGTIIPAEVLVTSNGAHVLQLPDALDEAVYQVAVEDPSGGVGDYFLGIDFNAEPILLDPFIEDSPVTAAERQVAGSLSLRENRLFHLVLSSQTEGAGSSDLLRLEVIARNGDTVATLLVAAGQTASTTVFLEPGDYLFLVGPLDGSLAQPVTYSLHGLGLSDPIGPQPADGASQPFPLPADQPTGSGYLWQAGYQAFVTNGIPTPGSNGAVPPAATAAGSAVRGAEMVARAVIDGVFAASTASLLAAPSEDMVVVLAGLLAGVQADGTSAGRSLTSPAISTGSLGPTASVAVAASVACADCLLTVPSVDRPPAPESEPLEEPPSATDTSSEQPTATDGRAEPVMIDGGQASMRDLSSVDRCPAEPANEPIARAMVGEEQEAVASPAAAEEELGHPRRIGALTISLLLGLLGSGVLARGLTSDQSPNARRGLIG